MVGSSFVSDDEVNSILSERYAELYDILTNKQLNYMEAEDTIAGTGAEKYDLPEDFYGVKQVDYQYTTNLYIPLKRYMPGERTLYENLSTGSRFPLAYSVIGTTDEGDHVDQISLLPRLGTGQSARVRYVPAPIRLEDGDDGATINGVSGWEELVVVGAAIDMLTKEESSTTALQRRHDQLMERVDWAAEQRELEHPNRIVDTDSILDLYWWQYVTSTTT